MGPTSESIYMRQFSGGAAHLRFEHPLESRFRESYPASNIRFLRVAVTQGLVFIAVTALLDWRFLPWEYASTSITVKLSLMAPVLLLLLIACSTESFNRHINRCAFLAGAALSVGGAALLVLASTDDLANTLLSVHATTVMIYLIIGLRLVPALVYALPLSAVLIMDRDQRRSTYGYGRI